MRKNFLCMDPNCERCVKISKERHDYVQKIREIPDPLERIHKYQEFWNKVGVHP